MLLNSIFVKNLPPDPSPKKFCAVIIKMKAATKHLWLQVQFTLPVSSNESYYEPRDQRKQTYIPQLKHILLLVLTCSTYIEYC